MAELPGACVMTETEVNGTLGAATDANDPATMAEREPYQQPRHEPDQLSDQRLRISGDLAKAAAVKNANKQ